jgi:competence ComEA-like helix-hairpin-helix protein
MLDGPNHDVDTADGGEPESPDRSVADSVQPDESLISRLRVVLWQRHQRYIARLLLACLIGMSVFFLIRAQTLKGLIDIDHEGPLHAEFQVDINTAQLGEIVVLPGVGTKLAQAIVEHRQHEGPFENLESLRDVPGIGEKKLEGLRPFLLPIQSPGGK